jgi:hypothetical protein
VLTVFGDCISDSKGSLGFKERKEVALKRAFGHGDEESTASRLSLVAFKMKNGELCVA